MIQDPPRRRGDQIHHLATGASLRVVNPEAQAHTLLCLPPAGGNSLIFRDLARRLPDSWRLLMLDPPGHGLSRTGASTSVDAIVEACMPAISGFASGRLVLLGLSFGGLIAHRLTLALEQDNRMIQALVICAARPPGSYGQNGLRHDTCDAQLFAALVTLGGIPRELVDSPAFVVKSMRGLREDLQAMASVAAQPSRQVVSPTYLFAGESDHQASPEAMRGWADHCARTSLDTIPGGHFFIQAQAECFMARLVARLAEAALERDG